MAKFKPGHSGNPGGRPKSAHTKRELHDMLIERFGEDFDPVVSLAEIAIAPETPIELRIRCLSEVAPYVRSRLKQVDHKGGTLEELVYGSMNRADALRAAPARVEAQRTHSVGEAQRPRLGLVAALNSP